MQPFEGHPTIAELGFCCRWPDLGNRFRYWAAHKFALQPSGCKRRTGRQAKHHPYNDEPTHPLIPKEEYSTVRGRVIEAYIGQNLSVHGGDEQDFFELLGTRDERENSTASHGVLH